MANQTETQPGNGENTIRKALEQIQTEINEAKRTGTEKELAARLIQELKDTKAKAELVTQEVEATGTSTHAEEGKKATETLVRIIEAAKAGIPVVENKPQAKKIIQELATKDLKDSTAAAIQTHLGDYLLGQKEIQLSSGSGAAKTDFEKDLESLKKTYAPAANLVVEALANQATQFGKTAKDVREQYGVPESQEPMIDSENESPDLHDQASLQLDEVLKTVDAEKLHDTIMSIDPRRHQSAYDYNQDYNNYYSRYVSSKEDKNIVAALYNKYGFVTYVKSKEKSVIETFKKEGKPVKGEEAEKKIGEEVSNAVREDISSLLDRIFVRLRRERAQKPFEEIARDDFYHGISVTLTTLNSRLDTLALALDGIEKTDGIKIKLFKEAEEKPTAEEIEIVVDGKKVKKTRIRIKPLPYPEAVNLSDFVKDSLRLVTSEASHVRQYLHDGRTIYYHPADPERGFYSGLSRYSEDLQGTDVDSIFNLPDGQLIQNAYQMYSKFLFEQFAKQDWRHEPDQFINQLGSRYSLMEKEVIEKLQKLYGSDYSRERIENAVHMGVGMSRAIFLNEPEMAAFADPVLDEKGGGTGTSYYTNDTAALSPLNPLHWFMRWQGEQQIYPFLFAPVDHLTGGSTGLGGWDHKKALELGKKYYESYVLGKGHQGQRLFIDELCNMARAGGPIQRKGWRQFFANEGNFIFEPNSMDIDALKTWKALENVGYEVMYDMVSSYGGRFPDQLMRASEAKDSTGKAWSEKRTEFFQFLYDKYFDTSQGSLNDYLRRIRDGGARETALNRIRKGEANPNTVEEEIEREVSDIFMFRVLSRMVAQRIPTRLVQDDRDRFSKNGISRYKELRTKLGMDIETFDKAMKDIGLAEAMLRRDTSKSIRDLIAKTRATDLKDIDMSDIGYRLDGTKLRTLLMQAKLTEPEIEKAVNVFNSMQKEFSGKEDFLNEYAQKIRENSYIGGATVGSLNESPFSLAVDELDLSLMAFRGTGPRIIPRAIGDIGIMERALWMNGLRKLKDNLVEVATNGKKDFTPLIQMLQQIKEAHGEVQGHNPQSYETVHKLASAIISYFKRDTISKGLLGLLRAGKPSSFAAEMAGGKSGAVWEWDATDIDDFLITLETKRLLPRDRYDPSKPLKYDALWINNPLTGRPFKLPDEINLFGKKIPLFRKRHPDYPIAFGERLRKEFGGKWYNIGFDYAVKYGPLFMIFIFYKFMKDALEEAQGTKKK